MEPWIALAIFVVTYGAIASDRVDRTLAALLGAVVVILTGLVTQEAGFHAVDWNVIFLLVGMMVIAGVMRRTGVFGWLAIRTVRLGRGEPLAILLLLAGITALLSAFLDNVTTIVLLVPVTLYIATTLRLSPIPFVLAEVLASNIGGTATLIGDPPNILIGSASGLTFGDFLLNLAPVIILVFVVCAVAMAVVFRGQRSLRRRSGRQSSRSTIRSSSPTAACSASAWWCWPSRSPASSSPRSSTSSRRPSPCWGRPSSSSGRGSSPTS
jgi:Na+/H+ antiporter NhaD/arsenite permease-like protein